MQRHVTRRYVVGLTSSVALGAVSGCLGEPGGGTGNATGTDGGSHHGDEHHHGNESSHDGEHHHGNESSHGGEHHHGNESSHNGEHHHGNESSHGGEHHHAGDVGDPVESATMAMTTTDDGGTHFSPHVVRVVPGGTVTFELDGGSHSATAYAPANDRPRRIPEGASAWDTGVLTEAGATVERTFEVEGVYDLFCRPHEGSGMVASVVVGEPSPDGEPGLAAPQSSLPAAARSKIEDLNGRVRDALE